MSATQNESLTSYNFQRPFVGHPYMSNASLPTTNSIYRNASYCVLPILHNHLNVQTPDDLWRLFEAPDQELDSEGELEATSAQKSTTSLETASASAPRINSKHPNQLDPYIDAVQVRKRVNNKRGDRVKAATPALDAHKQTKTTTTNDHVPNPSYYSKSVHIEESKGSSEAWNYSSGDSDDSDEEYEKGAVHKHHHYRQGKKHHNHHYEKKYKKKDKSKYRKYGKKKQKRPKKRKKKVYVSKAHYQPAHYHHKYEPKHEKIVYVKYKKPEKKYYEHEYHQYEHDKHHQDSHHHGHKKHYEHHDYHHDHYKGKDYYKSKGKLVHMDLMSKGKMSLAGILGQTLLCVNYLLVLKQPTYDKYSQHYYTKYAPHGGRGDTVKVKSGGPIILAHCGDLHEPRDLVHLKVAASSLESKSDNQTVAANATLDVQGVSKSDHLVSNLKNLMTKLSAAEQQAELVHLRDGSRLANLAPSSYYHASRGSLSNYQAEQPVTRFLSPIQNYLNRLLFMPASQQDEVTVNSELDSLGPNQVFGSPRQRARIRTIQVDTMGNALPAGNVAGRQLSGAGMVQNERAVALVASGRRVILVDGQPQVVQARDNLMDMRSRRVDINMRVTEGRRFGFPQRALRLTQSVQRAPNLQPDPRLGLAIRAPDQMQNDQPQANPEEPTSIQNEQNQQQQMLLDLPEYALSGDSIELTCNHRLQPSRLYSVKWFKDSVEFYRFLPENAPSKTSLFLPDVFIDINRSNSQSLYLRNVTHRSSGLYRCEVISEAPNFELLTGERRMQVYTLPDTGPRLNLLGRDEQPRTTTTIIGANGQLQTVSGILVNGVGVAQSGRRNRPLDPEDEGEDEGAWPFIGMSRLNNPRNEQQQQLGGPIVRCVSDRSNPVAQLRFLVNNRPVSVVRTLENSTLSYSDGLESNVISFRVQLTDFVLDAGERNSLERAASLKSAADKASTPTSTTTTTTTTKRPNTKVQTDAKKQKKLDKQVKNIDKSKRPTANPNANAKVQFDDHADAPLGPIQKPKKRKDKKRPWTVSERSGGMNMANMNLDLNGDEDAENSASDILVRAEHATSLPASGVDKRPASRAASIASESSSDNQTKALASNIVKRKAGSSPKAEESHHATTSAIRTKTDQTVLVGHEQQRNSMVTSQIGSRVSQGEQQVYSNFIRIKCISTVPTLGYEMISELSIPLTLLIPASQLSDALRQASGAQSSPSSSLAQINNSDDNNSRLASRRSGGDGNSAEDKESGSPGRPLRSGGSLQAPRTVVVDRVAQASGRLSSSVSYESKPGDSDDDGNGPGWAWTNRARQARAGTSSAGTRIEHLLAFAMVVSNLLLSHVLKL